MTQTQRIENYIKEHGSITNMEAMKELGILRLSARISDMRQAGINVISEYESGKNRWDEPTRWVRYYIREGENK